MGNAIRAENTGGILHNARPVNAPQWVFGGFVSRVLRGMTPVLELNHVLNARISV